MAAIGPRSTDATYAVARRSRGKESVGLVTPIVAISDHWIITSSMCSVIATLTTVIVTLTNFRQRRLDIQQRQEEMRDRQIERAERARERRLRERTILLAVQQETATNIQRCREHAVEPLVQTEWLRWAEELALIDGRIYRAAKDAEPAVEQVNHDIQVRHAWERIEEEQDAALAALLTLAGWIEYGLTQRQREAEHDASVPAAQGRNPIG
jgi:hypothetical protein